MRVTVTEETTVEFTPDDWMVWKWQRDEWVSYRDAAGLSISAELDQGETFVWELGLRKIRDEGVPTLTGTPHRTLNRNARPGVRIEGLPITTGTYLFASLEAEYDGGIISPAIVFAVD